MQRWFSYAAYDVMVGNFKIRLHHLLGMQIDVDAVLKKSHENLKILDAHLENKEYLELGRLTVADLAVYPYIALSVDGKMDLTPYRNVSAWIDRVKHLPWYVGMGSIEKPVA